jgi:hypothetical protein
MSLFQKIPNAIKNPIPESIQMCLEQWNSDPNQSTLVPFITCLHSDPNPCSKLATWFTTLIERPATTEAKVCWRIYCLIFYEMKTICDQMAHGLTMLTQMIQFAGVSLKKEEIQKHLHSFIDAGKRYSSISKDLGGAGILFFLPEKGESKYVFLVSLLSTKLTYVVGSQSCRKAKHRAQSRLAVLFSKS